MRLTRYFYVSCTKCGIDRDMLYRALVPRSIGDTFTTADSRKHCLNCKGEDFILVSEVKPDSAGRYHYEITCTACHQDVRLIQSVYPYNFKQHISQNIPCGLCSSKWFEVIRDLNIAAPATNNPPPNEVSITIQHRVIKEEELKFLDWARSQDTNGKLEDRLLLSFEDRHTFYKKWELLAYVREIFPNVWKNYNRIKL